MNRMQVPQGMRLLFAFLAVILLRKNTPYVLFLVTFQVLKFANVLEFV